MKIPLLDDGRVDIKTLRDQVDWDNLSAFESMLVTLLDYNWERLYGEIKEHPELAKLAWEDDRTLLGIAAHDGQFEVVKLLVESGADINHLCRCYTPIYGAVCSGNPEIVRYLIQRGVTKSLNYKCEWKENTPLQRAAYEGLIEIARLLIEAGADINSIDSKGRTPLDLAALRRRIEVVLLLVQHHARHQQPETTEYIEELRLDE